MLADTAGRLHTKVNLMEELRKVRRVADKGAGPGDRGAARDRRHHRPERPRPGPQFTEAADVTGVVLTKLDGSAKGGIVFAIETELGIPVKLVGLGETIDDLVPFDPDEFVDALFWGFDLVVLVPTDPRPEHAGGLAEHPGGRRARMRSRPRRGVRSSVTTGVLPVMSGGGHGTSSARRRHPRPWRRRRGDGGERAGDGQTPPPIRVQRAPKCSATQPSSGAPIGVPPMKTACRAP